MTPPPRPALEDAPRQPPRGPGRLPVTPSVFTEYTLHSHSFPLFCQDFLWFWVSLPEPAHSGPDRPALSSLQSQDEPQAFVSGLFDDSVSADRRLLTFSSAIVVFLFRPNKTPKLQLSPVSGVRSLARARQPDMLPPLTEARMKTTDCRPLLRLALNTGL